MNLIIDLFETIRNQETLQGHASIANMSRVRDVVLCENAVVQWVLVASAPVKTGGVRELRMTLSATGSYDLRCDRCLEPVTYTVRALRDFLVVRDEATAESLDLDADEYDVIAGSKTFDLLALIEDELLMALPPVPMHEDCDAPNHSQESQSDSFDEITAKNPFAVLSQLKPKLN
jgi:uncharacterized protein